MGGSVRPIGYGNVLAACQPVMRRETTLPDRRHGSVNRHGPSVWSALRRGGGVLLGGELGCGEGAHLGGVSTDERGGVHPLPKGLQGAGGH